MAEILDSCSPEMNSILEALGLDSKKVRSFTLRAAVDEAVTIEIEYFATRDEFDVNKLTKTFRLLQLDEIDGHK